MAALLLGAAILFSFCLGPSLLAFSPVPAMHLFRQSRFIMGTPIEITISQIHPQQAALAAQGAFQEIERIDRIMSTYRADSEVSQLNHLAGKGGIKASEDTLNVLKRALYFSQLSAGAFDITIAPLLRLWDFKQKKIPAEEDLKKALRLVNYQKIKTNFKAAEVFLSEEGMAIDLGAIAKGYAVDKACTFLLQNGIENFLINAGGDLRGQGQKGPGTPWVIGLKHPRLPEALVAKINLVSAALATSGDYEKFFIKGGERYHHLLNPITGHPARQCQSVTIMAPTAMDADALATTVFILGPDQGLALIAKLPQVHALIVDRRGRVLLSPHWPPGIIHPP